MKTHYLDVILAIFYNLSDITPKTHIIIFQQI